VTVVQVHGLRDPAGKHDTPARRAQGQRLANLVQRSREEGDLTVVCGDLNLLPGSQTFGLLAEIGLVDLVRDADTRTSRYPKPVRHASYLLVSDPGAVVEFEILAQPEVSDHRALRLEI
jgi:endonuclease/exonuclease/phosphatase family metal-dependent hydrolase